LRPPGAGLAVFWHSAAVRWPSLPCTGCVRLAVPDGHAGGLPSRCRRARCASRAGVL